MSVADLKQYLEKELHSKRFLQEGLDLVNSVVNAESEYKDILKKIEGVNKDLDKLTLEREALIEELNLANKATHAENIKAREIVQKAKEQAGKIILDAQAAAGKLENDTYAKLESTRNKTESLNKDSQSLTANIAELTAARDSILTDLNKLRSKLG